MDTDKTTSARKLLPKYARQQVLLAAEEWR